MSIHTRKTQQGMSLLELMIALGLGVFLIAGVVNVFLANKDSTQVETSLARLQENGRIALDLLVKDVQDAMYIGCNSGNSNLNIMATGTTYEGIAGWEQTSSGWTPALPAKLNSLNDSTLPSNRVGSDVLNLQHATIIGGGLQPSAAVVPSSTAVSIAANPTCLKKNDQVIIANCVTSHLFEITNEPACDGSATTLQYGAAENSVTSITPGYSTADDIYSFFDKTWFVSDTGRTRTDLNIPVYALYRLTNGVAEEMIEGVEYMQILYGQELDTGNIRYVPASDGNLDLDQVVALRIALLLQSFELVLDEADDNVYQVLDQSIDSTGTTYTHNGDRTLRRVFGTTAILRNRIL